MTPKPIITFDAERGCFCDGLRALTDAEALSFWEAGTAQWLWNSYRRIRTLAERPNETKTETEIQNEK